MEYGEETRVYRTQVRAEPGEQGLCWLGFSQLTPAQRGWSVAVTLIGKSNTKTQAPPSISVVRRERADFPVAQP